MLHLMWEPFFMPPPPYQQIDASTIREVATRYLYDKCPAVVGIGECDTSGTC